MSPASTKTSSSRAPSNGTKGVSSPESKDKGKAKRVTSPDVSMDEDEDEEDEEDEDEDEDDAMDEDEDSDSEEEDSEIDTAAILGSGRRTRGVKVDYTSKEALEKAGLKAVDDEDDE